MMDLIVLDFEKNIVTREEAHEQLDLIYDALNEIGIAGFILAAWDFKGRPATKVSVNEEFPISLNQVPDFVANLLKEDETIEGLSDVGD